MWLLIGKVREGGGGEGGSLMTVPTDMEASNFLKLLTHTRDRRM